MGTNDLPAQQTGTVKPWQSSAQASTAVTPKTRIRDLSTEQRNAWIERIFAKLGGKYGSQFSSKWQGHEEAAKTAWANDLENFSGEQIAWAVKNCRDEFPPSSPRFAALCKEAPRQDAPLMLADPKGEFTPEIEQKIKAVIIDKRKLRNGDWAVQIVERANKGEQVPQAVLAIATDALKNLGITRPSNAQA